MSNKKNSYSSGRGLDVGTSYIISTRETEGNQIQYTKFRDAFIKLKPSSPIAKKMMSKGLEGQVYFEDEDGYIVVGQDAIERAIERNMSVERPLVKGVISPKQKEARNILKFIFKEILGEPLEQGEKLCYSIPAQPVDQDGEKFDVSYHCDILNKDLSSLGYTASPINEAEAICYAELSDDNYTGFSMSFGAGMCNVCLMSAGEAILKYSTSISGDFVDQMAAQASGQEETVVQVEKESGEFRIGEEVKDNPILTAVSLYYVRLIDYTVQHLIQQVLSTKHLPKFTHSIPIIIAGGTSLAKGFVEIFKLHLDKHNKGSSSLPFEIKEVRHATDPLLAVSKGCLIASQL